MTLGSHVLSRIIFIYTVVGGNVFFSLSDNQHFSSLLFYSPKPVLFTFPSVSSVERGTSVDIKQPGLEAQGSDSIPTEEEKVPLAVSTPPPPR